MTARALGYLPDAPSDQDFLFRSYAKYRNLGSVPEVVDHRDTVTILDQFNLGACVSNAGFGAIQSKHRLSGISNPKLGNRLHGYWGARGYDKNLDWDAGSKIRNFFRFINAAGFMPEEATDDKYDISKFKEGPSNREQSIMFDQKDKMLGDVRYYRLDGEKYCRKDSIKIALANKAPIVFGTLVNEAFLDYSGKDTLRDFSGPHVGGHALYLCGYEREGAWAANSWSTDWGDNGFALISWDYLLWAESRDFWAVERAPYYSGM